MISKQSLIFVAHATIAFCLGATVQYGLTPEPPATPQLIGFNCSGHTMPLLAVEKDEFPVCEVIVPLQEIHEIRSRDQQRNDTAILQA